MSVTQYPKTQLLNYLNTQQSKYLNIIIPDYADMQIPEYLSYIICDCSFTITGYFGNPGLPDYGSSVAVTEGH